MPSWLSALVEIVQLVPSFISLIEQIIGIVKSAEDKEQAVSDLKSKLS